MSDLPDGWARATVEDLAERFGVTDGPFGSNLKTEHYTSGGPRVIRLQNIGDGSFRDERAHISPEHFERLRKHAVEAGDVLVAALGEVLPRACLAPSSLGQAIVKADCIRIRPGDAATGPWLMWALNSAEVRDRVADLVKGVGRPRINLGDLRALLIPVAPRSEQERIVTAIEEAFSKLDAGEAALRATRQRLKRLHESVLSAAVTGRLVPQDPTDEPASKLLADLGISEMTAPSTGAETLPNSWVWAALGAITAIAGGIQKQPKRLPKANPIPFLRVANVARGSLDLRDVHLIEVFEGELDRVGLVTGDLLVVEGNGSPDQIGRAAMWHGAIDPCVHQNHLIRVRPTSALDPAYLQLYWNSPGSTQRVRGAASSTSGLHTLSTGKLKVLLVAVPPRAEQDRIVAEVERQVSFIDACERTVDVGLARSAALRRSILKAAFEGKLVPQDSADEPAATLLGRVRAERGPTGNVVKPRQAAKPGSSIAGSDGRSAVSRAPGLKATCDAQTEKLNRAGGAWGEGSNEPC